MSGVVGDQSSVGRVDGGGLELLLVGLEDGDRVVPGPGQPLLITLMGLQSLGGDAGIALAKELASLGHKSGVSSQKVLLGMVVRHVERGN